MVSGHCSPRQLQPSFRRKKGEEAVTWVREWNRTLINVIANTCIFSEYFILKQKKSITPGLHNNASGG